MAAGCWGWGQLLLCPLQRHPPPLRVRFTAITLRCQPLVAVGRLPRPHRFEAEGAGTVLVRRTAPCDHETLNSDGWEPCVALSAVQQAQLTSSVGNQTGGRCVTCVMMGRQPRSGEGRNRVPQCMTDSR